MQKASDVFQVWPSLAAFARELGVPYPTAAAWKYRGSIPGEQWAAVIRAAHRRGHTEITAELLARIHAREADRASGFGEEEQSKMRTVGSGPETAKGEPAAAAGGHFSRFRHLRRSHFASPEEIAAHVRALREEWDGRS